METMFLTVTVVGILAVVSPGPDFLIVTRNSLLYNRRVGLATALGIAVGNIWWITASVLGLSYVLSQTVWVFHIIKWLGALYLIWLGIGALRSKSEVEETSTVETEKERVAARISLTTGGAFRIGLLTNLLNPKCAAFFVSFFSVVITPETPTVLRYAYGLEIMAIAVVWFSLLALVLSLGQVRGIFHRGRIWFDRATGVILVALGVKLFFHEQK